MTILAQRQQLITLIGEATDKGARLHIACSEVANGDSYPMTFPNGAPSTRTFRNGANLTKKATAFLTKP